MERTQRMGTREQGFTSKKATPDMVVLIVTYVVTLDKYKTIKQRKLVFTRYIS